MKKEEARHDCDLRGVLKREMESRSSISSCIRGSYVCRRWALSALPLIVSQKHAGWLVAIEVSMFLLVVVVLLEQVPCRYRYDV